MADIDDPKYLKIYSYYAPVIYFFVLCSILGFSLWLFILIKQLINKSDRLNVVQLLWISSGYLFIIYMRFVDPLNIFMWFFD